MSGLSGGSTGTLINSKRLLGSMSMTADPVEPMMVIPPLVVKITKSLFRTSAGPKSKGPVAEVAPLFEVAILHTKSSAPEAPVGPLNPLGPRLRQHFLYWSFLHDVSIGLNSLFFNVDLFLPYIRIGKKIISKIIFYEICRRR
jgi:hypothetical protein